MIFGEIGLGEVLWSLIVIFFMVVYWMIFFSIVFDLFRDHSMGGIAKAGWIIFLIFLPLIGMLTYVIVRGDSMAQRSARRAADMQMDMDAYVRETAQASPADQITKAKALLDSGTITNEEFDSMKAKALA
jgi:ABC-type cobalamin transport system permease subunit